MKHRAGSYVSKLACAKCGKEYSPQSKILACERRDDARLDIHYDYEAIKERLDKNELTKRAPSVWKYAELLPVSDEHNIITLGEGGTALIRADRLAGALGLRGLYLKDDTRNPTSSFKDRPMTVGVSKAFEFGFDTVVSASSGNAAAALAAYAARAKLQCVTFVPEVASPGKIAQLLAYGAKVFRVRGLKKGEDPTVKMLRLTTEKFGWYPCPSFGPFNPYQAEGPKTMSYEICEQLDWRTPDWEFAGVGAGGLIGGNWKGYLEFERLGLISSKPRMVAVQSAGCAPVVRAYEKNRGEFEIEPWEKPDSIATGLMDPLPWDGDAALTAIRSSKGSAVAVSNDQILQAQKQLAKLEGIFAEPSGVAALAGLQKMQQDGKIEPDELVVVEITGSGLKDFAKPAPALEMPPIVETDLESVRRLLDMS